MAEEAQKLLDSISRSLQDLKHDMQATNNWGTAVQIVDSHIATVQRKLGRISAVLAK